jgi:osmoprotectant transport system permease protein
MSLFVGTVLAFLLPAVLTPNHADVAPDTDRSQTIIVGSKKFTESVILGEMLRHLGNQAGVHTVHRKQLGGTRILWNALIQGEIDAYPEYTGTLLQETLAQENLKTPAELEQALLQRGLKMTQPLGFNNTYAIGVSGELAKRLNLHSISDLKQHPDLSMGYGHEFMDRADGWPGMRQRYRLPHANVRGLDHDLAYRGVATGSIDVMDMYSTDAEIDYYNLVTLKDDLGYFPDYNGVILYRADLEQRAPDVVTAFETLVGRIDAATMSRLNAQVKIDGDSEAAVAAGFLHSTFGKNVAWQARSAWQRFLQHTGEHLWLVAISLSAAIFIAIPLGIVAARLDKLAQPILGITGILQTIPSLALFVFMIPLLGIGGPPAVMALFLYSLLPIVRNTYAGLKDIPAPIIESAQALGLPDFARLRIVELPLAARSILAGIKTSAVINVGTATLAALIGAGGYGQPILTGIRLDDTPLILQGAVPAAVLALLVQGLFELLEKGLLPRSLRT